MEEETEVLDSPESPTPALPPTPPATSSAFLSPENKRNKEPKPMAETATHSVESEEEESEEDPSEESLHEEGFGLGPRKVTGQSLKWTRSPRVLTAYGIACFVLGICFVIAGFASLRWGPELGESEFQVEWKWANLLLFVLGIAALVLRARQSLAAMAVVLVASLLQIANGSATAVVHIANTIFRRMEEDAARQAGKEYHVPHNNGTINVFLTVLGTLSAIVSVLLYRHCLHIAGKNFAFNQHVKRHRLRLSLLGLVQIFMGILISGWWIAIQALFHGHNASMAVVPSSEALSQGLLAVVTGYVQMMATAKCSMPLVSAAALLNVITFFILAYFSSRPITLCYLTMEINERKNEDTLDVKFAFFFFLAIFYVAELLICLYSLIKFLEKTLGGREGHSWSVSSTRRRQLTTGSVAQVGLGIVYGLLEAISAWLYSAYAMDFSALPLLVMGAGAVGYAGSQRLSLALLSLAAGLNAYCASHSLRDLYLFIYHAVNKGAIPADGLEEGRVVSFSGGTLAMHFIIAIVALVELVLAVATLALLAHTILNSLSLLLNRIKYHRVLWTLKIACIMQVLLSGICLVAGLVGFGKSVAYLELIGDKVASTSAFLLIGALLALVAVARRSASALLLPALAAQIPAFALLWQHSDEMVYQLHHHLGRKEEALLGVQWAEFHFAVATLILVFLLWILTAPILFLLGELMEEAKVNKLESGGEKTEELVVMS